MGNGTGSDAGERGDSEPPAGWDAEHVAAHESFMRHKLKSGSTLREDTPSDRGLASYRVAWDGNNIVLPAARQDEDDAVGFTTWGDSAENLENFTRELLRTKSRSRRGGPAVAPVALLHRADNTYNRRAMAVATPASRKVPPRREGITQPCCRRQVPSLWGTSPIGSCERSASRSLRHDRQLAPAQGRRGLVPALDRQSFSSPAITFAEPSRLADRLVDQVSDALAPTVRLAMRPKAATRSAVRPSPSALSSRRTATGPSLLTDPRTLNHIGEIVDRHLLLDTNAIARKSWRYSLNPTSPSTNRCTRRSRLPPLAQPPPISGRRVLSRTCRPDSNPGPSSSKARNAESSRYEPIAT